MLISISRDTARQVKEVSDRDSIILPYGEQFNLFLPRVTAT